MARRGRHPVDPAGFIPVAEATDLIVGIGNWALRRACRQVQRWQATHRGTSGRLVRTARRLILRLDAS